MREGDLPLAGVLGRIAMAIAKRGEARSSPLTHELDRPGVGPIRSSWSGRGEMIAGPSSVGDPTRQRRRAAALAGTPGRPAAALPAKKKAVTDRQDPAA